MRFLPAHRASGMRALALAGALLAILPFHGHGQTVNKCEVGGKIVYQSQPCPNAKATTVKITGGPTPEEAEAARQRTRNERDFINAATPPPPPKPMTLPDKSLGMVDCASLGARREALFNRRNAALAGAKRSPGVSAGSPQDQEIAQLQVEIVALESNMRARGCELR